MENNKNLNSLEIAEADDIYLQFSGLLNWEKYRRLTSEEFKEWIEEDTKRRANEWLNSHFKDDTFNEMLYITTTYIALDYSYIKKTTIKASYQLSYANSSLTSFEQEYFEINPER